MTARPADPQAPESPTARSSPRFRLEGDDGQHWLRTGDNTIGSSSANDIVLRAEGVSRHHAVVTLEDAAVRVRDLNSKNGTLVNGTAVSTSPLAIGAALSVGPVCLRLAALDDDDAELAIEMPRPFVVASEEASSRLTETLLRTDAARERDHLRFVSSFLACLVERSAGIEEALLGLIDLLGARGCAMVERGRTGHPAVRAAAGGLDDLPRVLDRSGRDAVPVACNEDWAYARHDGADRSCALIVLGLPEGSEPSTLLATLVALLVHVRPSEAPVSPARDRTAPPDDRTGAALAMPTGIVPSVTPAMRALYEQIGLLRQGDLPVLILGESGVGKEHIARLVHDSSEREGGPFVAINCAAIPSDLLEAEMFGIGRGVATGVAPREGKFQMADRGTLFLDEIGDMSPELQAKLLRSLQEREIVPLGCEPVRVDVRVVAATNTDLQQRLKDGAFRLDLYYRLAGYEIEVPPLRARRDDLPALVGHFVRLYSEAIGKSVRGVSVKALRRLCDYGWPGNVRELKNLVRRLVYVCPDGHTIESALLPSSVIDSRPAEPSLDDLRAGAASLPDHLEAVERRMIRGALAATAGNQTRAAELLGVSRNGLAYRLKRLRLEPDERP